MRTLSRLSLLAFFATVAACSTSSNPPAPQTLMLTDGTTGVFAPEDALGVGENMIDVTLSDAAGSAMSGVNLNVDAFMPAHGHGLRQPPHVHDMGDGHYMIHIDFHMTGHWDMSVALAEGEGAPTFSVPLEVQ